jgi:hypothetical protein
MRLASREVEPADIKRPFAPPIHKTTLPGIDTEGPPDSHLGDASANKEASQDRDIPSIGVNTVPDSTQASSSRIVVTIDCPHSSSGRPVQAFVSCSVSFGE